MKSKRDKLSNALQKVVASTGNKGTIWAINYACYAIEMIDAGYPDEDIKTQLLYVLNNITHWRSPEAKEVRAVLKAYVNEVPYHS